MLHSKRRSQTPRAAPRAPTAPTATAEATPKLLLNTRRRPENFIASELYEEIVMKNVPIAEWPNYVVSRMSGGEPLSAWL